MGVGVRSSVKVNAIQGFGDRLLFSCKYIFELCFWQSRRGSIGYFHICEIGVGVGCTRYTFQRRKRNLHRSVHAELLAPSTFRGVIAAVPAILDWLQRFGDSPGRSMTRNPNNDRRNHRNCSSRNLLKTLISIVRVIKNAIARTVPVFLLLGKSEKIAFPHTPVLPARVVEFRSTSSMAAKSTAAVFAGANHRGAGAEVVTVV
jgi:hypothetical protein